MKELAILLMKYLCYKSSSAGTKLGKYRKIIERNSYPSNEINASAGKNVNIFAAEH